MSKDTISTRVPGSTYTEPDQTDPDYVIEQGRILAEAVANLKKAQDRPPTET